MAKANQAAEKDDVDTAIDSSQSEREEQESAPSPVRAAAGTQTGASGLRNVWTIGVRELRSYFDSLVAYIVLGGSMLAIGVWFFLVPIGGSFWQTDHATMSRMFEFMPKALLIVIPLVTMRSLAEEKRSGTLELLITMPVRDSEVILGKFFGATAMVLILFVATLLYPIAMFGWPWHLGPLDWGPVLAGYLGLVCYALGGVAFGMMVSALTESQIIAFFITAATLALFLVAGFLTEGLGLRGGFGDAIAFFSFDTRYSGFARGLIDTKAVVYFLSITLVCLLVSFRSLESRKWK